MVRSALGGITTLAPVDRLDQRIGIECLVCDHGVGLDALDQRRRLCQIVRLSSRQLPARQIAQPFDQAVNLSGQPAARAPDRLIAVFFWGAGRMLVGSDDGGVEEDFLEVRVLGQLREDAMPDPAIRPTCKTFVHTVPGTEACRQIPPRRDGASDPQTASTNKRLSLAVTPTSVALPVSMPSMRAYWSSRSIFRDIAQTPSTSWSNSLNAIVNMA